ncbi:TPA: hypothetical protein ON439_003426 [Morganella morganii]|nr:hypothetical protein [Morganella morganii]
MYINKVISYKNAWGTIQTKCNSEISDIESGLEELFTKISNSSTSSKKTSLRESWEILMRNKGWSENKRIYYSPEGVKINLSRLGVIKNRISAAIPYVRFDSMSRWLFEQSAMAVKYNFVEVPIIVFPVADFIKKGNQYIIGFEHFESILSQIYMLSPLSLQYPFLILGYSDIPPENEIEVIEISSSVDIDDGSLVINRCIEFSPEYHQAGLGILNYFGTYLREQYPDEDATVKIEQKGLHVRLIVKTADGKSEVIDKALHEYELIMSGSESPERFAKSDKLVLDLKNELRIANVRIESQRDLICHKDININRLLEIIGNGLMQKNQVLVDFKPEISISNNMNVNQFVSSALGGISELIENIPEHDEMHSVLKELENSLISIESDNDAISVRRSPAMSKFTRFMNKVTEAGSGFNLAMKNVDKGWEVFSDLANRYNKLADWCGLPKIPSVFLK